MDNSSLESIFSEQVTTETATPEVTQPETVAETKEPEQVEQTTGEEAGTPPETQKEDPLDKARKGLEAAASAERKKRQDAEAREAAVKQELEALRRQIQQPPVQQPQQQSDDPKPQRAQFQTEDEWLDARDAWRDRQQVAQTHARQQEEEARILKEKSERIVAEAMTLPGFDLQAFVRVPVTEHMFDAILESDVSAKLVHHLQANPQEATRIAGLSKAKQIAELTRIEDKLTAAPESEVEKPAPKEKPQLPQTLTQARDARGRFEPAYDGPTPLNAILATK